MGQRLPLDEDPELKEKIENVGGMMNALASGMFLSKAVKARLSENWRMQQSTFRAAMKAAKSGKNRLSDGTIDDRVLCEYCGRKFGAKVA